MNRILIGIIIILVSLNCHAQHTLLFEISKDGNPNKSYLFGTLHLADDKAFSFNDSVFWAIDQSDITAFEIDQSSSSNDIAQLGVGMFKGISKKSVENVKTAILDSLIPSIMARYKPKELAQELNSKFVSGFKDIMSSRLIGNIDKRSYFVDLYLDKYARMRDKKIMGIETIDEQLNSIVEGINVTFESDEFYKDLNHELNKIFENKTYSDSYVKQFGRTLNYYSNFDLDSIGNMFQLKSNLGKELIYIILDKRNFNMLDRTLPIVDTQSIFIAVGAGHLVGENGLINLYRKNGYTVRPMDISTPYKMKEELKWKRETVSNFSFAIPDKYTFLEDSSENVCDSNSCSFVMTYISPDGYLKFEITKQKVDYPEEIRTIETIVTEESEATDVAIAYEESYIEDSSNEVSITTIDENSEETDTIVIYSDDEISFADTIEGNDEINNSGFNPFYEFSKIEFTTEQKKYFKKFSKELLKNFDDKSIKSLLKDNMRNLMSEGETSEIVIDGETYEMTSRYSFLSNTKYIDINRDDWYINVRISGDKKMVEDSRFNTFFTSIKFDE